MIICKEFEKKVTIWAVVVIGMSLIVFGVTILYSKWVGNLFLSAISFWRERPPDTQMFVKLHLFCMDTLLVGVVAVVIGWLVHLKWSLVVSLAKNKRVLLATPICAILLIWLLITAKVFYFHCISNEVDGLPLAKQFVEHNWLPNDWYLNLNIDYRQPFNLILGTLVSWLGFQYGSYTGRLLVYLLLAIAIYTFFRTFHLRFSLGLLVLLFFLDKQSLIAGEWIVGGVDTKTIAYAFVLLSCSTFFRKRYLMGFAFAGAATSFHVLVGLYAMFCIAVAVLLNRNWRSEWRIYSSHSWVFFITGIFGLKAIINQLFSQSNVDTTRVWEILVQYRELHHLLPSAWSGYLWIGRLVLATCLFIAMYLIKQSRAARFVAAYALGSVSLFFLGLVIYTCGEISLLRYFWFRFPDVMVPFMSVVLVALVLNDFADGHLRINSLSHSLQYKMRVIVKRGGPIILTFVIILFVLHSVRRLRTSFNYLGKDNRPVFEWIAENTPKQAVFLVDPTIRDFYIKAQRAQFVNFKHFPQSSADILEWYERIKLSNGGHSPSESGFASKKELQSNFYDLNEKQIRQIANSYGISYYLGLPQQRLTFKRVYSNSNFTVYNVNETDCKAKDG